MVTSIYGCSTTKQKEIRVNEPFDLKRIPLGDTTVYLGDKVQLNLITSAGNVTYSWKPAYNISCESCSDPWVSPGHTTIYTVEARNGCFDLTENFNVEVLADFYLEAPKAFTPNGDSNNDIFLFEQKNISSFNLKIFNRWGEIVYSTNDIQKGWDGYVNGHLQNVDTYEYIVKATTVHGFQFEKRGEFLLLK